MVSLVDVIREIKKKQKQKKPKDTNDLICRTETDSETLKTNVEFPKRAGGSGEG